MSRGWIGGVLVLGLLAPTACGDDDAATVVEAETAETIAEEGSSSGLCAAVDSLAAVYEEALAPMLALGVAIFQLDSLQAEGEIEPARAERFGTELVEVLRVARSTTQSLAEAWRVVSQTAPEAIASEVEIATEFTEGFVQGYDVAIEDYEAETDWPARLETIGSSEELLAPIEEAARGELDTETEEAINTFVLDECGADLNEIGSDTGGTAGQPPGSGEQPGTAEQVEDLFNGASREEVAAAFAERLGLTPDQSDCFLATVDFDDLIALEAGGTERSTSRIIAVLTSCGIDAGSLGQ